jgi:16S rRNA (cytosine967-C5)-methyltransferase
VGRSALPWSDASHYGNNKMTKERPVLKLKTPAAPAKSAAGKAPYKGAAGTGAAGKAAAGKPGYAKPAGAGRTGPGGAERAPARPQQERRPVTEDATSAAAVWAKAAPKQRKTPPAPAFAPPRPKPEFRESHHRDLKPALQVNFQTDLRQDSLAFALLGAATAVAQVRSGMALPQALAGVFANTSATPQARGAMQDIAYRAMRALGHSDALIALMAPKAPEPLVAALLACALPLMQKDADGSSAYEQFTVVDQTVTAAWAHPDTERAKPMVNAVLRRFQRERKELLEAAALQPVAKWNYPQWWIDAVRAAYPDDWQAVLATGNQPPPLTLRVNARRSSVADYLKTLEQAGIAAAQIGPQAVRLAKPVGVHLIPGFDDGVVSVQDAAAQLAAQLLDVQDGMRVLDACAAPGGKTCNILELADADVTALDADAKRLARVGENLERLGLKATLKAADAQHPDWWDGQAYDRILADVPCTASGIVRRHPDIRWLRRKGDTLQLATLSGKILDNLWQMLAPNGKLLFVTCSLWPQESEAQAAAFAVRHGATRLDAPGQLLPTGSAEQDHDGLFYALFQKNA